MFQQLKSRVMAFPQNIALPAELAAFECRGEPIHQEERQSVLPAFKDRERAPVAPQTLDVAVVSDKIERKVVDDTEAQPDRVVKADAADAAGEGVSVEHAVRRKRKHPIRD